MKENKRVFTSVCRNLIRNIGMVTMQCLSIRLKSMMSIVNTLFCFYCATDKKTSLLTNNERIVWLPTCHAHKRTDKQNQITILFHLHLALIIIQIPTCIIFN